MDVIMPQLGETVGEGTIAGWYKQAGDAVEKGDVLLDVETDKVATEIEAPASGILASIDVPEGETVDVGTVLAVITVEGEVVVEKSPASAESAAIAEVAKPAGGGLPGKQAGERLSPAVRRLLKEHNLDIKDIPGTGRDGRVTRQDVVDFVESNNSGGASGGGERIPFDRVKKITAEHMVRSKATSPHVLQTIDVDFHAVDASRLARKEQWKSDKGYSLSYRESGLQSDSRFPSREFQR